MGSVCPLLLLVVATSVANAANVSLSTICANPANYSLNNTIIELLNDEEVDLAKNCRINSVVNLTIQGSAASKPTVRCIRRGGPSSVAFVFTKVKSLVIRDVTFEGCGGILEDVDVSLYPDNSLFNFSAGRAAIILCSFCQDLVLENVEFVNNTGYAFAAISLAGESVLDGVVVNGKDDLHLPYNSPVCNNPKTMYSCGYRGVLILFIDFGDLTVADFSIQITNSLFDSNYNAPLDGVANLNFKCVRSIFDEFFLRESNYDLPDVGALTILYNQRGYNASVNVTNTVFTNNLGTCYGAVLVIFVMKLPYNGQQVFKNCTFVNNSPIISDEEYSWKYIGRDLTLYAQILDEQNRIFDCISVLDSSFNSSGYFWNSNHSAISMTHFPLKHGACQLYMENIYSNVSKRLLFATGLVQGQYIPVFLKDIMMIDHHKSHYNIKSAEENYGLMTFAYISNVTLFGSDASKCKFYNLIGPALLVRASNLYITGEMSFVNIQASKWAIGSAIMLQVDSTLWLREPLRADFCNNTAVLGGAIGSSQLVAEFCAMLYEPINFIHEDNLSSMNISMKFTNNSADLAGNSIYLQKLYTCTKRISPKIRVIDNQVLYNSTLEFVNKSDNGLLEMSSTPHEVCLCQGRVDETWNINCARDTLTVPRVSAYPGETFSICVLVVDEIHNPVHSFVYVSITSANAADLKDFKHWELGYGQNVATVHGTACTVLNFTLYFNKYGVNLVEPSNGTLAIYPYGEQRCIAVPTTLMLCPLGFELVNASCDCNYYLGQLKFVCDINKKTLTKQDVTQWVGEDRDGTFLFSAHCPLKYCNQSDTIDVTNLGSICRHNRTGILCGGCSPGLSSMFGGPNCRKCSNLWLLTIPIYALASIILVVLLFLLRLTVTNGTISGAIFFANLFNINTYFFLGSSETKWLQLFISWLNLELGFPICFFHGMTDLHASYLSYIIPVYLWLIVLVIIYLSRHFQTISNLTSRTAVPVLATLIHLSFSRLLRLSVDGLIFTQLLNEKGEHERLVWYFNGNVDFCQKNHLGLLLLALISLCLFVIPYTVFFTGIKYFLRFKVVNKYRPLIDAFCAPYKSKYSYWFGVRLWLLVISYIVYASRRDDAYLVVLLTTVMLVCFTITQAVIMPYKNTLLNILELLYLADSIIMYTVALYTDYEGKIVIASSIIMTPAVLLFLATIAYHVYTYVLKEKFLSIRSRNLNVEDDEKESEESEKVALNNGVQASGVSPHATYAALAVDNPFDPKHYLPGELREPLIESDSDDH